MIVKQILSRFYVSDLDTAIPFYENLLHVKCQPKIAMPSLNLELTRIENILLIAGSAEALKPYRNTQATFLVDSLNEFANHLKQNSSVILRGPNTVPTGVNMTVQHPDGTIIEYVEHRK